MYTRARRLASTLVSLAPSKGIHVALNLQFNSAGGDDPAAVLQRVVDSKVRVLFVMLTLADWNVLVPVAAQMGLTSASYVWIASSYQYYVNIPNLPVGLIAIGEYLNTSSPMYKSITAKWADAYKANPSNTFGVPTLGLVPILHYNVIKFGAQVLSNLQKGGVPWTPANIIQAIRNTTWPGIGGTVRLKSNGDSPNNVNFANYQVLPDGTKAWAVVGTVFDGQPLRTTSAKVQWGMGRDGDNVPIAAPQTLSTRLEPSPGLTTTMVALASVVVVVAVLVLAFNVYYRSNPYVKMSTPAMNNVVAVGVVLCMAFVYLLAAAPTITSPARFAVNCNARLVCLALGFTLSFGSLFIKTYRVAQVSGQSHPTSLGAPYDVAADLCRQGHAGRRDHAVRPVQVPVRPGRPRRRLPGRLAGHEPVRDGDDRSRHAGPARAVGCPTRADLMDAPPGSRSTRATRTRTSTCTRCTARRRRRACSPPSCTRTRPSSS